MKKDFDNITDAINRVKIDKVVNIVATVVFLIIIIGGLLKLFNVNIPYFGEIIAYILLPCYGLIVIIRLLINLRS